jgi:transaldolase
MLVSSDQDMASQNTTSNRLQQLRTQGQSIWLDYIRRSLITSGGLKRLIEEDGLTGVTSNPSIFEKAIGGSTDYDHALGRSPAGGGSPDSPALYDQVVIEDVRMAADTLRSTYEQTAGTDGFVSIEPQPQVTSDTAATVAEGRRLWAAVNRPNLMIKVVATREGIAAVEQLISEGINVNITLMFSQRHYEAVAQAYLRGAERTPEPSRIASVASFFVSRIDTAVDDGLEANGSAQAIALRGKIAIANAKLAYRRFRDLFHGNDFRHLQQRGIHPQRVLWASTGTKNPDYRDVLYVEELIGPETVNTLPPKTLDAFRNHGNVRGATVLENVDGAAHQLHRLAELGIDLDEIAERLQIDGIAAFATAYDHAIAALDKKKGRQSRQQPGLLILN